MEALSLFLVFRSVAFERPTWVLFASLLSCSPGDLLLDEISMDVCRG